MGDTATATDRQAIAEVMQLYIDGAADGDSSKLEAAFHEQAWMFGEMGGQRLDMPIKEFFGLAQAQPLKTDDRFEARLVAVEQTGNVATAVVEEDGAWGLSRFATTSRWRGSTATGRSSTRRLCTPGASRRRVRERCCG
jgi:hypothetical protein